MAADPPARQPRRRVAPPLPAAIEPPRVSASMPSNHTATASGEAAVAPRKASRSAKKRRARSVGPDLHRGTGHLPRRPRRGRTSVLFGRAGAPFIAMPGPGAMLSTQSGPRGPPTPRRRPMRHTRLRAVAFAIGTLALAPAFTAPAAHAEVDGILNVSYDIARELYAALDEQFSADFQAETGRPIKVDQSHAGSSKQARAIMEGPAGRRRHLQPGHRRPDPRRQRLRRRRLAGAAAEQRLALLLAARLRRPRRQPEGHRRTGATSPATTCRSSSRTPRPPATAATPISPPAPGRTRSTAATKRR